MVFIQISLDQQNRHQSLEYNTEMNVVPTETGRFDFNETQVPLAQIACQPDCALINKNVLIKP